MNGYQAGLAELRSPNGENAFFQVHIFCLQVACFADPQSRHGQQPQQAVIGLAPQAVSRRQPLRGPQQVPDLIFAVQVRVRPPRPVRQQAGWWDLGLWIMGAPVAIKAADEGEPPGPFRGTRSLVLLCPFHRQRNGDVFCAALFQKRGEAYQAHLGFQQFESQTAAQIDVVLDCFTP